MSTQPSQRSPSYIELVSELKARIAAARLTAALAVNRELVLLYWSIGSDILNRQRVEGWGARVIERLAADLQLAFPDTAGLSARNLKYMRAFEEAWPVAMRGAAALAPWRRWAVAGVAPKLR